MEGGLPSDEGISVVIITRNRPVPMVAQVLEAVARQSLPPLETLVVDTSSEDFIQKVIVDRFPKVQCMHIPDGPQCMPWSRNRGIAATHGEIVAFLDDDSIADPQWLAELIRVYKLYPEIAGVGGRIIEGPDLGGSLKAVGEPVAFLNKLRIPHGDFDTVTPTPVDVDHLKGCNMSFRRSALVKVGGFDEFYSGIANREETDICVRMRKLGYRLVYCPTAVVNHKTISLYTKRRMQIESIRSGFPVARLDGYYVAKNFGNVAWAQWYFWYITRTLANAVKISLMVFTRALLGLGGGPVGLMQALFRPNATRIDHLQPNPPPSSIAYKHPDSSEVTSPPGKL